MLYLDPSASVSQQNSCYLLIICAFGTAKILHLASSYTHWTLHSWPTQAAQFVDSVVAYAASAAKWRQNMPTPAYARLRSPANCLHSTMCRSILAKIFTCKKQLCSNALLLSSLVLCNAHNDLVVFSCIFVFFFLKGLRYLFGIFFFVSAILKMRLLPTMTDLKYRLKPSSLSSKKCLEVSLRSLLLPWSFPIS